MSKTIHKVVICGAGTMGPGLAQVFASGDYKVTLFDISEVALKTAESVLESNIATFVEQGLLDVQGAQRTRARIQTTDNMAEAVGDADLIIECVSEKLAVKKGFYEKIDTLAPVGAYIASNTSYLNIFEIAPKRRLSRTLIAHWFAPPHIVPLVEIVRGEGTSTETVDLIAGALRDLGKTPVILNKFVPGFCINRILRIIGREVFYLLDNDIISAEDLDLAVKASIIPRAMILGLVQRYDFTGLDLSAGNLMNPGFIEPPIDNEPQSLMKKISQGKLGVKTGEGFYSYTGQSLEEINRKRDLALIKIFQDNKDLLSQRI